MSKVTYFQRYSSPENAVTNNTLQLFARIYDHSITKLNEFLCDLLGEKEIGVGIEINQQTGGRGSSVPDGLILQRSFKIVVESKVGSGVRVPQLIEHCKAFSDEKVKILVLLTKEKINKPLLEEIENDIHGKDKLIIFKNVTYEDICKSLDGLFEAYEDEITGIAEDYKAYCRDTGLMDEAGFLMRIVPTGASFDLNKKHGIYFQPFDRGYSQHAYIGFYRWKAVSSMMKVESVFDVRYENEQLTKACVNGQDTNKFDTHIIEIIKEAKDQCHWEIQTGHRFFCADQTFDTDFKKTTSGGIQGARFVNLKYFEITDFADTTKIAAALKTKTWG
jgi:hypothetical protein